MKYLLLLAATITSYASDPGITHKGISYDWHWPESSAELSSWSKIAAYKLASYLTDPLCKAREYSIRLQILQELPPSTYVQYPIEAICSYVRQNQIIDETWLNPEMVARFVEKCFLLSGTAAFSTIAPFTTIPAMILRFAASHLENESFIHYTGRPHVKELEHNKFTHMLWNICGVKGGYDIEEGCQMPIRDDLLPLDESRLFRITQKILSEDPDVLCLNEVFDINDAIYLVSALQNNYAHFILQCGSRTVGLNSGLFLATKFQVKDISFTPFPKDMLVDKTKYAEKGFLSVNIHDTQGSIATMILSHLQHSNEPGYPTKEEELARKEELDFIMKNLTLIEEENIILSGDLNLDDKELMKMNAPFYSQFKKTIDYTSSCNEENKTWLGDHWYVEYGNRDSTFSFIPSSDRNDKRKISTGLNLDHILVKLRSNEALTPNISTVLKSTGYNPTKISRESLSDHMILISSITLIR